MLTESEIQEQLQLWASEAAHLVPATMPAAAAGRTVAQRASTGATQRRLRHTWLAAAVATAAGLLVIAYFVAGQPPESVGVATDPGPQQQSSGEPSRSVEYEPGWTELDPGPLSARQGAALIWTGAEVVVLGGEQQDDGAAFDIDHRVWRRIADPPLPPGTPEATWTGHELLAVVSVPGTESMHAASYDPTSDRWRALPPPPPPVFPSLGGPMTPGLSWTGTEAILSRSWAMWSPRDDSWKALPEIPNDLLAALQRGEPGAIAVSEKFVWVVTSTAAVQRLDLATGDWEAISAIPGSGGGYVDARIVAGDLLVVTESGAVHRFSGVGWEELLAPSDGINCAPEVVVVANRPIVDVCGSSYLRYGEGGGWTQIGGEESCCYPNLLSTGNLLVDWSSTFSSGGSGSLENRFRVWSPNNEVAPSTTKGR